MDNRLSKFSLFNEYCVLEGETTDNLMGLFQISINPDSRIFNGHFPGDAVCPGVCHIELIRECASLIMKDDMRISRIQKCRFTSVAKPDVSTTMTAFVSITPSAQSKFDVQANISDGSRTYLTFSGAMHSA